MRKEHEIYLFAIVVAVGLLALGFLTRSRFGMLCTSGVIVPFITGACIMFKSSEIKDNTDYKKDPRGLRWKACYAVGIILAFVIPAIMMVYLFIELWITLRV